MAQLPTLPSQVNQKRQDGPVQGALDNIVTPLNTVLQWLRSVFTYTGGLLTATFDNLVVNVKATIAQLVVTTLNVVNATVTNLTATTETVTTLTVTGTETVQTLNVTGTATANSVVSAQGFKSWVVGFWNSAISVAAATPTPSIFGATSVQYPWVATRTGSVVGISVRLTTNAAGTVTFAVYKNAVLTTATVAFSAANAAGNAVFAKGAVPFVAGDMLDIRYSHSAGATSTTYTACFEIEEGA